MKLVRWKRFTWDLKKVPPLENTLPADFSFREAPREEAKAVINTVMTSFTLDSAWSDVLNLFLLCLEMQLISPSSARACPPSSLPTACASSRLR